MRYKGYNIRFTTSGGKAGKGMNKTASIQVSDGNVMGVWKVFRYRVGDRGHFNRQLGKAKLFIDELVKGDE